MLELTITATRDESLNSIPFSFHRSSGKRTTHVHEGLRGLSRHRACLWKNVRYFSLERCTHAEFRYGLYANVAHSPQSYRAWSRSLVTSHSRASARAHTRDAKARVRRNASRQIGRRRKCSSPSEFRTKCGISSAQAYTHAAPSPSQNIKFSQALAQYRHPFISFSEHCITQRIQGQLCAEQIFNRELLLRTVRSGEWVYSRNETRCKLVESEECDV